MAAERYGSLAAKLSSLKERATARFAASCNSLRALIDGLKARLDARYATVVSEGREALKATLKAHVAKEIGALARPDDVKFTDALPKTRSGKIMRRLLRDIAANRVGTGDTTTLEDYGVLAKLRADEE